MKTYLAVCNQCGAAAVVPTPHAEATIANYENGYDVIVSRCGMVYRKDYCEVDCDGDFIITGTFELTPLASTPPTDEEG